MTVYLSVEQIIAINADQDGGVGVADINGIDCVCDFENVGEHERGCPGWEPPLTQAEIREVRRLLAFAGPILNGQVDSSVSAPWSGAGS